MTCIIGIEEPEKQRAVVFADSGMWRGEHKAELTIRKLWRDGDWIIGAAGHWSCLRILRQTSLPEPTCGATALDIELALGDWSELVLRRIGELASLVRTASDDIKRDSPAILVACHGFVFDVEDCSVTRCTRGWEAIGMWTYAAGALAALRQTEDPFSSGVRAMRAVGEVTSAVMAPIYWLATDGTEGVL